MGDIVQFLHEPTFKRAGAGRLVMLEDMPVRINGVLLTVRAPFITDGASIPKWIEWIMVGFIGHQYAPSILRAATLHDWMCTRQHHWGSPRTHTIFRSAARSDNVAPLRAWIVWAAVRAFGPRWKRRLG